LGKKRFHVISNHLKYKFFKQLGSAIEDTNIRLKLILLFRKRPARKALLHFFAKDLFNVGRQVGLSPGRSFQRISINAKHQQLVSKKATRATLNGVAFSLRHMQNVKFNLT